VYLLYVQYGSNDDGFLRKHSSNILAESYSYSIQKRPIPESNGTTYENISRK
jgi:hypothetical protein